MRADTTVSSKYIDLSWEQCLLEARQRILNERMANRKPGEIAPELPTEEEAMDLAREIQLEQPSDYVQIRILTKS